MLSLLSVPGHTAFREKETEERMNINKTNTSYKVVKGDITVGKE